MKKNNSPQTYFFSFLFFFDNSTMPREREKKRKELFSSFFQTPSLCTWGELAVFTVFSYYTMMWMQRALWLVVAHELLEYRYMDDVTRNLFNLFCSKWRAVLKILVRLFRIKQVKASKKAKQELFTKRKNGERETNRAVDNLRKLKLQEIFTTVAIASSVIARGDSLFCKMFSPLFWFEQEKTLKNYSKKLYASKIKKKEKQRRKIAIGTWKMP